MSEVELSEIINTANWIQRNQNEIQTRQEEELRFISYILYRIKVEIVMARGIKNE